MNHITNFLLGFTLLGLPATIALAVLGWIDFGWQQFLSVGVLIFIATTIAQSAKAEFVVHVDEED